MQMLLTPGPFFFFFLPKKMVQKLFFVAFVVLFDLLFFFFFCKNINTFDFMYARRFNIYLTNNFIKLIQGNVNFCTKPSSKKCQSVILYIKGSIAYTGICYTV